MTAIIYAIVMRSEQCLRRKPWIIVYDEFREVILSNKKSSILGLGLDRLVHMADICYSSPISAVPTNE